MRVGRSCATATQSAGVIGKFKPIKPFSGIYTGISSPTMLANVMAAHRNRKDLLRLVFSDSSFSSLGRINDLATAVNDSKSQKHSGYSL